MHMYCIELCLPPALLAHLAPHSSHISRTLVLFWFIPKDVVLLKSPKRLCLRCRWVYRKLLALGGNPETRLTEVIETGIREVDGGHWHYRDLQDATRDTDLSLGFR